MTSSSLTIVCWDSPLRCAPLTLMCHQTGDFWQQRGPCHSLEIHNMNSKKSIDENEFMSIAEKERCRACLSERSDAVAPTYVKYAIPANEFITEEAFPTWRTNKEQTIYIGAYETPPTEAFPISFNDLAQQSNLFPEINFDPTIDYLKSKNIISFYCVSCGVHVVKDGNHRLLQCAVQGIKSDLDIFEVVSSDWSRCKVDMKNFCKCISNNQLNPDAPKSGAPVS